MTFSAVGSGAEASSASMSSASYSDLAAVTIRTGIGNSYGEAPADQTPTVPRKGRDAFRLRQVLEANACPGCDSGGAFRSIVSTRAMLVCRELCGQSSQIDPSALASQAPVPRLSVPTVPKATQALQAQLRGHRLNHRT